MPKVTKVILEQQLSEARSGTEIAYRQLRETREKLKIVESMGVTMPVLEMMTKMNEASAQVTTAMLRYLEKRNG